MSRPLLKDQAYDELKRRIIAGAFAPGRFLAERGLAEELGMSKTPVRAAVGRLEAEGFLAVSPQQGIVVRELSFREITDHFDARIALEDFVVRRVPTPFTPRFERLLLESIERQRLHAREGQAEAYATADADFHRLLARSLGNAEIDRLLGHQLDKLRRVIVRVLQEDPKRMMASTSEHERIADAIAGGGPARASRRLRTHIDYAKGYLI